MNLPFFIARRYLFSKKKHNAINIISGISVCGVALATLALVCTLSVFNGFQDMVAGFFTAFDPELKITVREGKVFDPLESRVQQVRALPEIDIWMETLEENAMVQYKDRQAMAVIKGVEDNFEQLTSIDSLLYGTGEFILNDSVVRTGYGDSVCRPATGVRAQKERTRQHRQSVGGFQSGLSVFTGSGVCRQPAEVRRALYPYIAELCATPVQL